MPRFLSTYSSNYLTPPCEKQEAPEVNFPGDNCKKCSMPCQMHTGAASQGSSRRNSCSSNSSRVRSIQQIDFAAVPQIRNCRCQCQCCVSKAPERAPPLKPLPAPTCQDQCATVEVCEDPCCRLHRVRTAQIIAQDPNCYEPKCRCKPRICPAPPPCNCCEARNDDPKIRHCQQPRDSQRSNRSCQTPGFNGGGGPTADCSNTDLNSCSRNLRHDPCYLGPVSVTKPQVPEHRRRYFQQMETTMSTTHAVFVNRTCPRFPENECPPTAYGESIGKLGQAISDSGETPCCYPCYSYCC